MSAYNESNFNKLLDEYNAIKTERNILRHITSRLANHLKDNHAYTEPMIAEIVKVRVLPDNIQPVQLP
jgi:hypothetical protein